MKFTFNVTNKVSTNVKDFKNEHKDRSVFDKKPEVRWFSTLGLGVPM